MSKDKQKVSISKLLYEQHGQHSQSSVSEDGARRQEAPGAPQNTPPGPPTPTRSMLPPPPLRKDETIGAEASPRRIGHPVHKSQPSTGDDEERWTSPSIPFGGPTDTEGTPPGELSFVDNQRLRTIKREPPMRTESLLERRPRTTEEQSDIDRQKQDPVLREAAQRLVDFVIKEAADCAKVISVQKAVPRPAGEQGSLLKWDKGRRDGRYGISLPNVVISLVSDEAREMESAAPREQFDIKDSMLSLAKKKKLLSRLWRGRGATPVASPVSGSMLTQSLPAEEEKGGRASRTSSRSAWRSVSFVQHLLEMPRSHNVLEWSFSKIVVIDIIRNRKDDLVCSARHTFSGEWAILKIVWKKRWKLFSRGRAIARERKTWDAVSSCQFIVGLKSFFSTSRCYCFVAEYYEGCTLQSLLDEGALRDDVIVKLMSQITYAIKYIHDRDLMFRNLSPHNILVDMHGTARLFDFGFCSAGKSSSSRVGSIPYMAPEVLRMEVYDKASDYWSLGILIYVMYVRHTPMSIYSAKTNLDHWVDRAYMYQYAEVVPIILPTHLHDTAKSLISDLLVERPRLRIGCRSTGFFELMKHPYFKGVDWEAFGKKKKLTTRNAPRGRVRVGFV
ncbi:protein kinase C-like 3 [Ornithodoros turicata]|uniref:protein kinase C-like 3 n=1 Tax=Ornithodoros turicata TaxID=34597 RepID=UPI0031393EBC